MKFFTCLIMAAAAFLCTDATAASAAQPTTISVHPDKPTNPPGNAKGHHQHSHKTKSVPGGKAKGRAHGTGATADSSSRNSNSSGAKNENKKITFCHVPPGNPANGHLITTSVNAIDPGHTNHPGDIIPPFTFVKHGKTVTFPGQNWTPAGRAILANGCKPIGTSPGTGGGTTASGDRSADQSVSGSGKSDDDGGAFGSVMPNTGGPRLALLVLAVALVSAGGLLLVRRRTTV